MARKVIKLLTGPQQKFCEGLVKGLTATEAYVAAFPDADPKQAAKNTTRLTKRDEIQAEIARLRAAAESVAGSAVLTLAEKRMWLARLVRANLSTLDLARDGDLLQEMVPNEFGMKLKLAGKIDAIKLDNDLAGEGSEAKGNEGLAALIARIRK